MMPPGAILERPMSGNSSKASALARRLSPDALVRPDEPLAGRTTLRVGGPADLYVEPASEADLAAALQFCAEQSLPCLVIGRGSNLLVRDGGFRGVAICLAQPGFCRIEVAELRLHCGAGARLKDVAVAAKRHQLTGLEFLEGIPGTIGGALRMNAGAMGGAIFDAVQSVRLMDSSGRIREWTPAELSVEYRSCSTLQTHLALAAVLAGRPDSHESIAQRMIAFSQKRWATQPAAPSAGCMFKNPPAIPAGRLIDELGLKGARVGGASVSIEHGNFIVNDGTATARDVLELIELLQQRAKADRGIELQTEVEIVGEDG
jgi:UDP-N-acetylenolpyruvoylglucosamine reductase